MGGSSEGLQRVPVASLGLTALEGRVRPRLSSIERRTRTRLTYISGKRTAVSLLAPFSQPWEWGWGEVGWGLKKPEEGAQLSAQPLSQPCWEVALGGDTWQRELGGDSRQQQRAPSDGARGRKSPHVCPGLEGRGHSLPREGTCV